MILKLEFFLLNGKKGNIVPIHIKGDKETPKNYFQVSFLRNRGKSEILLFKKLFRFFIYNKLFHQIRPVLEQGNSCITQLLLNCY